MNIEKRMFMLLLLLRQFPKVENVHCALVSSFQSLAMADSLRSGGLRMSPSLGKALKRHPCALSGGRKRKGGNNFVEG